MKAFIFPSFCPDYSTGLAVVVADCDMEARLFLIAEMIKNNDCGMFTELGISEEVEIKNGFVVYVEGGS